MTKIKPYLQDTFNLAKVKGVHGLKGHLLIWPLTANTQWIYGLSSITLKIPHTSSQSFEIQHIHPHKKGFIAKLKGLNDRTEAEKWQKAEVHVPRHFFTSQPGEKIYLMEIKGFTLVNTGQKIGPIVGFASNGPQDLLQVDKEGQIYEVPFVTDFLVQIDWQAKNVHLNLPEGLLGEF